MQMHMNKTQKISVWDFQLFWKQTVAILVPDSIQ